MNNNKKILVCGGAGFIGSHLCKRLLEENNHVICLDNFYTGNMKNILYLKDEYKDKFEIIEHNIIYPIDINVDEIYNLACPASPIYYQLDPIFTWETSVLGSRNLLELSHKYNCKILLASTSEIYGDPLQHPQKETYFGNVNTIGLRSCYDEGKRAAETIFSDYHRYKNVDTRIVRIFNTYGENMCQNDGRVISNFIVQALRNEDITIYGNGTQTRSFCYVSDLVDGLIKTMNSNYNNPINLGNTTELTINEIANNIILMTNTKSKIIYKNLPQDDPKMRKPDISLAKSILDWEPKVSLSEGLNKTIDYFKTII